MQRIKLYFVLTLCFLFSNLYKVEAQRRVVVAPSRTIVVTRVPRKEVVYIKTSTVVSPAPVGVTTLPPSSVTIVFGHRNFFYHEGVYYALKPDGYVVVNPPVGVKVSTIPASTVIITFHSNIFYYISGVFYIQVPGGYKVVSPPVGAKIMQLPNEAVKISVAGEIYYERFGTLYKKLETEQGFSFLVAGYLQG